MEIRPFHPKDATQVQELFITVNRTLAPADMKERFETYITASIQQEIGQINTYYAAKKGQFWVAYKGEILVGMVGIEHHSDSAMELRRMYVSTNHRRQGIAHQLLQFVEGWCRDTGIQTLVLSTSELQPAAIQFYEKSGFQFLNENTVQSASNKTIGGGIRRRYYSKDLAPR